MTVESSEFEAETSITLRNDSITIQCSFYDIQESDSNKRKIFWQTHSNSIFWP
jgi:hypothetical protein